MKITTKKFDRFQGVTEEELFQRKLEDVIDYDLDILFVNINPGLFSVFKGHHYAGPGNHFYRCLQMSGLTNKALKSYEDHVLLQYKFGLANMLKHPTTKGCQELSADDIKEARDSLKKRVHLYRPKIVAFNGRSIYEIFTGTLDKDFNFGKQPKSFPDSKALMFVMPSSSARNSQLPKVSDKVPFYRALKMLRDHMGGKLPRLTEAEITFPEFKVIFQNLENGKNGGKNDFHSMSESNSDTDSNEDKQADGGKDKIFLNNLSFSELPKDILKQFQEQKLLKKNVLITTTTQKFRRDAIGGVFGSPMPPLSKQSNGDFDDASSDGSLNNFSAITSNLSNGISVIKNGHQTAHMNGATNGKHTVTVSNGNHYSHHKEIITLASPSLKPDPSKNVKIRDIVDPSDASAQASSNMSIKLPITQISNGTLASNTNLVYVSNGNGTLKALPQQQANTVQFINAGPGTNQSQFVRYVLVQSNQPQQTMPAPTEYKTVQLTDTAQPPPPSKAAAEPASIFDPSAAQCIDMSTIDFDNFIPLEQISLEHLAYDQFYNFDTLGGLETMPTAQSSSMTAAQHVIDLRDSLKFYYENDDANNCHHQQLGSVQVKRTASDDQQMVTKRRCKLNIFDL